MGVFRKPAMGLVVTAGAFALIEGALRLAVPAESLRFSWESSDPTIVIDDHGGLLIPPDSDIRQHDGQREWVASTNSLGLREDAEIPAAKPAGSYRMLALGDSWMFGWAADQGWSLPSQLEVVLPDKLGGAPVEVINAGVFGTCAFDMLRRWRQYKDRFEIDAVLLGTPHNMSRQQSLLEKRSGWYDVVRGAPFVDLRLYLVLRRVLAPYTRPQYPRQDAEGAFTASVHDLTVLSQEATAEGLDAWFVLMPTQYSQPVSERAKTARGWVEAMSPAGVRFAGHLLPQRSCWGDEDLQHPSASGYRALAEVVSDAIAAGASEPEPRREPSCDDVPGYGPGKK